jgi:kynurenine formamidase
MDGTSEAGKRPFPSTFDAASRNKTLADVLALSRELSNWGRWGDDDEIGTVNFITRGKALDGAECVRQGRQFSLAIPFDKDGPQAGQTQRFNPMLFMTRDGNDIATGAIRRLPRYHKECHSRFTDDVWLLPSQTGTQWDALAHCLYDNRMYNGFPADAIASWGTTRCGIEVWKDRIATRGVLLDMARWAGLDALAPGDAIGPEHLEACCRDQNVEVGSGDIVLIRTGMVGQCRADGSWGDYAGGDAPGLSVESARWIHERQLAGVATDTWGAEVLPNETADVFQPFHVVALVHMGLLLGEIFDLEALAADCAEDGQYDFLFVAPPLPMTGAVGSPLNPIALK